MHKNLVKLKLDGGSLTQAVLEYTVSMYKAAFGHAPPQLSGSLAFKNLEFSKPSLGNLEQRMLFFLIGELEIGNSEYLIWD
jgi:hypothetical protein